MSTPKTNDTVNTPNGPGVVQGILHGDGEYLVMVAHPPTAPVNFDLCKGHLGNNDGRGNWIMCMYLMSEVSA